MPDITVTDIPPINVYTITLPMPNGVTRTVLPFGFSALNASQVSVYSTPGGAAAYDDKQKLIYGTDYTVQINPAPAVGGTITLTVEAPLQARITIVRNTSAARISAYSDGSLLSAATLNNDFNSAVMIEQEINRYITKLCPHYNHTENTDESDYVLPRLNPGQIWSKGILPGSVTEENRFGISGIVADNITNVIGGYPITLADSSSVDAGVIPRFADNSGNLKGSGITISDNNILYAKIINCNDIFSTGNISVSGANNAIITSNLSATTATVDNLSVKRNLSVGFGSTTTLSNTTITGTLDISGTFEPPSITTNEGRIINLNSDKIEVFRLRSVYFSSENFEVTKDITLPNTTVNGTLNTGLIKSANITSSGRVMANSLQLKTPLSTDDSKDGDFQIGRLLGNNYVISNARNDDDIVIAPSRLGSLALKNPTAGYSTALKFFASHSAAYISLKASPEMLTSNTYSLVFPIQPGMTNQTLVLSNPATGQLIWGGAGGGSGGVNPMSPVNTGKLVKFYDDLGNITSTGISVDSNRNVTDVKSITIDDGGTITGTTVTASIFNVTSSTKTNSCSIVTKPGGNNYSLTLPAKTPTFPRSILTCFHPTATNATLEWRYYRPSKFIMFTVTKAPPPLVPELGSIVGTKGVTVEYYPTPSIVSRNAANIIGFRITFSPAFASNKYMIKVSHPENYKYERVCFIDRTLTTNNSFNLVCSLSRYDGSKAEGDHIMGTWSVEITDYDYDNE